MDVVKLEGGRDRVNTVKAIVGAGIPVMGHLGLTPQSVHKLGGYRTQGKTAQAGKQLLDEALLLQEAGCFSLVLESIPARLGELVSQRLDIPTIGIGAGPKCDGQVLVIHDLLGLFDRFTPRFVKQYARLHDVIAKALREFKQDVETGAFPTADHSFTMSDDEWEALQDLP